MEKSYLIRCKKTAKGREVKYHLDWGWSKVHRSVWTYSERGGSGYDDKGKLRTTQMKCVLSHFGLVGYKHAPRYKGLLGMSPSKLCALRRKREEKEGLPRLDIKSHRIGDHVLAEEVY